MNQIASPQASSAHPAKSDRLNAIANGWNCARGLTSTIPGSIPAPQPQQNPPPVSNDVTWIYLSTHGNNDMIVYLSVNGKNFTEAPLYPKQP